MLRDKIKKTIFGALKDYHAMEDDIYLEHPGDSAHGDFSTNVAMQLAKKLEKSPQDTANFLVNQLIKDSNELSRMSHQPSIFDKIEIAGPGFINFFLKLDVFCEELLAVLNEGDKYGISNLGGSKKVNIEFISANPTGELHIGNGRGAFFGDALSNVLDKAGYKVTREYYVQDSKKSAQIKELGRTVLGRGSSYKTLYLEKKIQSTKSKIQNIFEPEDAGFLMAQEIQKDIRNFIDKKLKIRFDERISEEDLYEEGRVDKIYKLLKKKKLVYKKEGAEWFKGTMLGARQDYVLVRGTGEPTYLLPDLAYHDYKFSRRFSKIINIWGADHQGHVEKIRAGLKVFPGLPEIDFLITQMVRLKKEEKLSKRLGRVITLERLIDDVGLDATRFFYLMKSLDTQMEFDVELAKEKSEKNPVYYVQYAHARICSILNKFSQIPNSPSASSGSRAKSRDKFQIPNKFQIPKSKLSLLIHPSEVALIKELVKFPEIIEDTAKDYQVQRLPHYAIKIADLFHRFYHDCRVLSDDKELTKARLSLVLAVKIVIKNVLDLMGIDAPERM